MLKQTLGFPINDQLTRTFIPCREYCPNLENGASHPDAKVHEWYALSIARQIG